MSKTQEEQDIQAELDNRNLILPSVHSDFKLLRKVFIYHAVLAIVLISLAMVFPSFTDLLPVGGVTELVERTDSMGVPVGKFADVDPPVVDSEIVNTVIKATASFDRMGQGRQLIVVLIGIWLLVLPVSWVHKGIHRSSSHDHSLDETTLILPGIVSSIVLVVQHSLALAFSLAGIVAGVHFRRALQDTFDALFILVAIGTGISAGIGALEISAVLTVFFCYSTLYVYYVGDGLESHHEAHRKALKQARKAAEAREADERSEI